MIIISINIPYSFAVFELAFKLKEDVLEVSSFVEHGPEDKAK